MELTKQKEPIKFIHGDVTFLVRPHATEADRLEIWAAGKAEDGKIVAPRAEFVKALIRCFVVGWEGVTQDGNPVPYAYETFVNKFPKSHKKGETPVFLALGNFIYENTDIAKQDGDEKNGLPPQPTGSLK